MEQQETREQKYLRILESGPSGREDYEAVRYLKDKGYTDSPIEVSRMRDSYGQVKNVIWLGPNSNGIDFIDRLRAGANLNQPKPVNSEQANEYSAKEPRRTWKPFESPLVQIAVGVAVLVLFGVVAHLFELNFGVKLK